MVYYQNLLMKEDRRVRYPFDDSELHWCPVYNNEWVQVNKLSKIIPGVTTEDLMERWSDFVQGKIPKTRTGRACNFVHFDNLAEALRMCPEMDQNLIEDAVNSLRKVEQNKLVVEDVPVRKRMASPPSPTSLESDDVLKSPLAHKKQKGGTIHQFVDRMENFVIDRVIEEYKQSEEFTRHCEEMMKTSLNDLCGRAYKLYVDKNKVN